MLKRKADEGVKIYIIVYQEIPENDSMDSAHTVKALEALSPNIFVMRHPSHDIFSPESVYFWSHHEKLVIVDNRYVALGGLDLCFGRWDTHNHYLADAHPTQFNRTLFPGQDYNNSRVLDFQKVQHFVFNQLSTLKTGRMSWHDIHVMLVGPSGQDAVLHFAERWNFIKGQKYANEPRYLYLPIPTTTSTAESIVSAHPMLNSWANTAKDTPQLVATSPSTNTPAASGDPTTQMQPTCRVQFCRSASEWSHGVIPTEQSIQNAYIQLIKEAKHFIYIENQFFISATESGGSIVNLVAQALRDRILQAASAKEKFKVIVMIPEVPGFPGTIRDTKTLQIIMGAQWRTINRAGDSIMEQVAAKGFDPKEYISFYHLRSYDRINGPPSFLSKIREQTKLDYEQAQAALDRIWLGRADAEYIKDGVNIYEPDRQLTTADPTKVRRWSIPKTVEEAMAILKKYESASSPSDKLVADSVASHALREDKPLVDERWLGTPGEEKDCFVTELTYIHTKVMIVDDQKVIIGSANLNDRSLKGDGDSEIAVVIEDTDIIESQMDGKPYQAARFAATLRRQLFKEHLGLIPPQNATPSDASQVTNAMTPVPSPPDDTTHSPEDKLVQDPLSEEFLSLWNGTAKNNTSILLDIFKTVPNNQVHNWTQYSDYVPKVAPGHVATDLSVEEIKKRLDEVRGHIVEGGINFLNEEQGLVTGFTFSKYNPLLPLWV